MDAHLIAVLLSWTVSLTNYPHPDKPPVIEYRPHSFFVEHACGGNEKCRVGGWYDNKGIVYIDERVMGQEDPVTRSLYVHEFTHYLQDLSGKFDNSNCEDQQKREREAYSVQRRYINKIAGRYMAVYAEYLPCLPG